MQLSNEQQYAFNCYLEGKNVFITGPGGSGKSELIKRIYKDASTKNKNIQITALTGCAAVLLNCKAQTIHSWSGIKLAKEDAEIIIYKIKNSKKDLLRWKKINILVVDEVSMMSKKIFDLLNNIGKSVRNSSLPFGGIQIIFSGDFYQLPPVGNILHDGPDSVKFCFESEEWYNTFSMDCQIELITLFRQENDLIFQKILNDMRKGIIKKKSIDILLTHVNREYSEELNGFEPTKLFPTKNNVENINKTKLIELKSFPLVYEMYSKINTPDQILKKFTQDEINQQIKYLETNSPCEKILTLKLGAQVMSVINIKRRIMYDTGALYKDTENIEKNYDDDDIIIFNGSQGIIIDFVDELPVVRFNNGIELKFKYHEWSSEKIPDLLVCQIPLILSWALTIHKTQGCSLDFAELDIGNSIFECGQTYVALSRVRSLNGLYLKSFDYTKIKIHKNVYDFYSKFITPLAIQPENYLKEDTFET
jgi:ATP-dependent DNA helicase PIF1